MHLVCMGLVPERQHPIALVFHSYPDGPLQKTEGLASIQDEGKKKGGGKDFQMRYFVRT